MNIFFIIACKGNDNYSDIIENGEKDVRWEMEDGRCEMEDGRWEM